MERKTKHRILGAFVIVAFIVILLPLFQSGSELPTETKLVKAPPFPDQTVQVATPMQASAEQTVIPVQSPQTTENDTNSTNDIITAARPSVVNDISPNDTDATSQTNTTSETKPNKVAELEPALNPEDDDFKAHATTENVKANEIAKTSVQTASASTESASLDNTTIKKAVKLAAAKKIKLAKLDKKSIPTPIKMPLTDNGLVELKNAVWVIQIGSFKNKANALRLVNQLRANGYRAFIQQISNTFGENTRVFVGPEYKRHSARALADRLESDMHIHGMVISYKPLTL